MSLYPSLEDMKVDQMVQVSLVLLRGKLWVYYRLFCLSSFAFLKKGFIVVVCTVYTYILVLKILELQSNKHSTYSTVFQAQTQAFGEAASAVATATPPSAPAYGSQQQPQQLPYPMQPQGSDSMYPGLSTYMGLEFDEQTIRENMPEYLGGGVIQSQNVSYIICSNFFKFLKHVHHFIWCVG